MRFSEYYAVEADTKLLLQSSLSRIDATLIGMVKEKRLSPEAYKEVCRVLQSEFSGLLVKIKPLPSSKNLPFHRFSNRI